MSGIMKPNDRMYSNKILGERVKKIRGKRNMSLSELSEKSNVSISVISKIENNKDITPSVENVYNLAKALNASIDYLTNFYIEASDQESDLINVLRETDSNEIYGVFQKVAELDNDNRKKVIKTIKTLT